MHVQTAMGRVQLLQLAVVRHMNVQFVATLHVKVSLSQMCVKTQLYMYAHWLEFIYLPWQMSPARSRNAFAMHANKTSQEAEAPFAPAVLSELCDLWLWHLKNVLLVQYASLMCLLRESEICGA